MDREAEKRIAATMAKTLAMMCVRNTGLEDLHAGIVPTTHTGDYSDVRVIDADGREIGWNEASHLDNGQMRDLMREIVSRLYTFTYPSMILISGRESIAGLESRIAGMSRTLISGLSEAWLKKNSCFTAAFANYRVFPLSPAAPC